MLDFTYVSPTWFVFGHDAECQAGAMARRMGIHHMLVHYGQGSAVRSGLLARVLASLEAAGVAATPFGGAVPNPTVDVVREGIRVGRAAGVDAVLGVGGGSAIDSAKAIALGLADDGDVWDFFQGTRRVTRALPIATVITLAGTGTEGSRATVLSNPKTKAKRGLGHECLRPTFSLMNPALTATVSPYQTACGVTDMLSHILERYLTNTPHVDLTDRMAEAVMKTIVKDAKRVMAAPDDYEVRASLLWASTVAHNDLLGVGREQDWSSHQIEHELSARYDVAHGAGLAVVMPAFMRHTLDHDVARYARFAVNVFDVPESFGTMRAVADEGIHRFLAFLRCIGMPTTLAELGVPRDDIASLAAGVRRTNGERVGFFCPLDQADIEALLTSVQGDS